MHRRACQKWMTLVAVFVAGLMAPGVIYAQSCALCYNDAAAANAGTIQALRSGILVLLIPPVLIFGAICMFALRNRSRFNDGNMADDTPQALGRQLPWMPAAAGIASSSIVVSTSSRPSKSSQGEDFSLCLKESI